MQPKFSERNIVITGAASGMGKAIAIAFAKEGANLVLGDVDVKGIEQLEKQIKENHKVKVLSIRCDVSDETSAKDLIEKCVGKFGSVDVLINNAGIALLGTASALSVEDWNKEIDVNLKGVFLCSKYAVDAMLRNGKGNIINIASGAGLFGTGASVGYCASKGGVVLLTKAMALDHARDNIRINSVAPGIIDTPFNQRILDNTEDPAAERKGQEDFVPIGRLGTAEEIAKVVVFVASDDASYITGSIISVDGGLSAM